MDLFWQPGVTLDEVEKQVILAALKFYQGNRTHAADSLGISVRTIQNKLSKWQGEKQENDATETHPA
jgi:DNA-binding NtrC family response regulator